ncbi:unnamed protein product, partial [Brenthis ino]
MHSTKTRVAALLTLAYLVYQYRTVLFKLSEEEDSLSRRRSSRLSRSRSRTRSRSRSKHNNHDYKLADSKHGRRGRKPSRRCPDCSLCNYEE